MQSSYDATFEREVGGTESEWLSRLPGAVRDHALTLAPGQATVAIGDGRLQLNWQELPPRCIALLRMSRLAVQFRFDSVDASARHEFMRYFDLFMQRGGG